MVYDYMVGKKMFALKFKVLENLSHSLIFFYSWQAPKLRQGQHSNGSGVRSLDQLQPVGTWDRTSHFLFLHHSIAKGDNTMVYAQNQTGFLWQDAMVMVYLKKDLSYNQSKIIHSSQYYRSMSLAPRQVIYQAREVDDFCFHGN